MISPPKTSFPNRGKWVSFLAAEGLSKVASSASHLEERSYPEVCGSTCDVRHGRSLDLYPSEAKKLDNLAGILYFIKVSFYRSKDERPDRKTARPAADDS